MDSPNRKITHEISHNFYDFYFNSIDRYVDILTAANETKRFNLYSYMQIILKSMRLKFMNFKIRYS